MSPGCLYWDLENFTNELWFTLHCIDDTWWHANITSNDDDPPTSLSQVLAAYKSTPWTTQKRVTVAAREWQGLVSVLVDRWAKLARKAARLRNTCREMATKAADRAASTTAWARELQDEAARYGRAQENVVELGPALGGEEGAEVVSGYEAWMRRDAREAASEATRATMVRQWVEEALGLLERLVAACDEAAAFPRELQRLLVDIEAALKGTNEASPDVPEDLVAKVAEAEWLWEANVRLAKDHLLATLPDIIDLYFGFGPAGPRWRRVAEQCQRAIEDIPRLIRPLQCPQSVPKVSPVSMEHQELSPVLLQPQVTVVAILGELLATLPRLDKMILLVSQWRLYWDLVDFTENLRVTLYCIDDTWWHRKVTSDDDDNPLTSLSQALAAYKSTPWTTWDHVTMVACKWQRSVDELVDRSAELARKATKLHNTCREAATEAANRAATATAQARELQDEAARDGTGQEIMVELGLALGGEEGAEVVSGHEAQMRRDARVAASEETRATMVRQRLEVALGLLERLVAACDEATTFPRELQRRVGDIVAALKGTNHWFLDIPEDLVAKVVEAERLWEANARLAKDHLLGTLPDIIKFYFDGGPTSPSACGVAEPRQRTNEDIPKVVQPLEHRQGVPKLSPVGMELQELSLSQPLEALVSVVATLGKVVATVTKPHCGMRHCVPPKSLHAALRSFTWSLSKTLDHPGVSSLGDPGVTSLGQTLATLRVTRGASWADVRAAASSWWKLLTALENSWEQLKEEATKLCDACEDAAPARAGDPQDEATHRETAGDSPVAKAQQLMVALDSEEVASTGDVFEARVAVATDKEEMAIEEEESASEEEAAPRRLQRPDVALGLLEHLVVACERARYFVLEMRRRLEAIEAILKGTKEASLDVPEALVATVAEAERLWDASTRLATRHLVGILGDICRLLTKPPGGPGGSNGPGGSGGPGGSDGCTVAEKCQEAIKDIPRLLQEH
ncbi:uncharacterized protein LOC120505114 [Passer montanus]|uniref:uncharacterized protein LOC120505114 n=1 Tax=Passer montanus TaxID=9160 RepID=UPI001960A9B4|nr:uncharacterized protein LOC120505114 [Passer montanus]